MNKITTVFSDVSEFHAAQLNNSSKNGFSVVQCLNKVLRSFASKEKKFYLWGAGQYTKSIIESRLFDGVIEAIVDKNSQLQGSMFSGIRVVSFDQAYVSGQSVFLIANNWYDEISTTLLTHGLKDGVDFINIIDIYKGLAWIFNNHSDVYPDTIIKNVSE